MLTYRQTSKQKTNLSKITDKYRLIKKEFLKMDGNKQTNSRQTFQKHRETDKHRLIKSQFS